MCRGNSLVMIISISVHSSPDAIRGCSFTIHCGSFCKVTSSLCFFLCHIARNSTSPLHVPLFCVDQDYPLKLPYGHIARKSNSPLYELMFCVYQDYPLQLPYGNIFYKYFMYFMESWTYFCVEQDDPLKLPYGHIVCKVSSTLHLLFFCVEQDYPFKLPYGHIMPFCVEQDYCAWFIPFSWVSFLNLVITFTSFRPPLSFSCIIIAHAPKPLSVIMCYTLAYPPLLPTCMTLYM